jgi:hypothetical protein
MGVKISDLTAKASKIASTDLIEIAQVSGPSYVSRKVTGSEINELSLDTSPQLGGNLDVNGNTITSASNGDVIIRPNGTGTVVTEVKFNTQTTNYVLDPTDASRLVEMNLAGANTLTIPTNLVVPFPIGTQILIAQYGAGQTTVTAAGGVTLRSSGGKTKIAAQYGLATLIKRDTNEWYLAGDITT